MKKMVLTALVAWGLGGAAALSHAQAVNTVLVATGLTQPLFTTLPVSGGPLYVVEKAGLIKAVQGGTVSNFLQISVGTAGERGLLGLAFDPNYAVIGAAGYGRLFVDYIDPSTNQTVIASYRTNGNPLLADPSTRVEVMRIDQTPAGQSNHKGGWIGFKPGDVNHLYIATGDGGSSNDPSNQAQNKNILLGKMLRININGDDFPSATINYAVPTDNPFFGQAGARGEVFAYGLRNPFRNSFDRLTGNLWIGDVGQGQREEVDFIGAKSTGGQNFGWRIREGDIATPGISDPPVSGLIGPALVYNHSFGIAITGGYVVRQAGSPLYGMYVFADYGSGRIWAIDAAVLANGQLHALSEATEITAVIDAGAGGALGNISSFGEGAGGELYIVDYGGKVVQVVPQPGTVALTTLSLAATSVNAGGTTTGTVTLSAPAQADTVVSLSSSSAAATVPASVVVAQGASSANFVLSGFAVVRDQRSLPAVITATLAGNTRTVTVTVLQRP
jgi:glucose/arabinose dehydrogenase